MIGRMDKRGENAGMPVEIPCRDGVRLGGWLWPAVGRSLGRVIINPATGVAARYYHRYARFLARHGYNVLTYDYRGIGASRPGHLAGCGYRWRDWGELDFDAAVRFMHGQEAQGPLNVVGHSVGGFLIGLADSATLVDRVLAEVACRHAIGDSDLWIFSRTPAGLAGRPAGRCRQ